VTCAAPILTLEGDLIVAGTPGTVISWEATRDGEADRVLVRWDHYLFAGAPAEAEDGPANTHGGLRWPVAADLLRWHGGTP
jgi:hypothetical protein